MWRENKNSCEISSVPFYCDLQVAAECILGVVMSDRNALGPALSNAHSLDMGRVQMFPWAENVWIVVSY